MIVAFITQTLVIVCLAFLLLRVQDQAHKREQHLLNRIQAPEQAVAETIVADGKKHYISEADEDAEFAAQVAE